MYTGNKQKGRQAGFTIVELLMATAVFSIVLLIATTGIIKVSQDYYKGITQNRTQEASRNVSEDITRTIQLANGSIQKVPGKNIYCVGGTSRYTFKLNRQIVPRTSVVTDPANYSLLLENKSPNEACDTPFNAANAREMLGGNMRLLHFDIREADTTRQTWRVQVRVAYGDNDLLTSYDNSGNRVGGSSDTDAAVRDAQCKSSISGNNFCATARLDTLVKRRLNVDT